MRSSTALVRIEGRVLAVGTPVDRGEAQAWLERISLLPLGANPKKYQPPAGRHDAALDVRSSVRDQVHALDGLSYFRLLAALLAANPPAAADAPIVPFLARLGLAPGKDRAAEGLDASVVKALDAAPRAAQEKILTAAAPVKAVSGWTVAGPGAGAPGSLERAAEVAAGYDRTLDGVTFTAEVDGAGRPLDGGAPRVLRFTRGKGPPAEVLWTLTVYDERGAAGGRQARAQASSPRGTSSCTAATGRSTCCSRPSWPRGHEANWLQVPPGPYALVLRLHGPREKAPSALDGSWRPPAVVKAR